LDTRKEELLLFWSGNNQHSLSAEFFNRLPTNRALVVDFQLPHWWPGNIMWFLKLVLMRTSSFKFCRSLKLGLKIWTCSINPGKLIVKRQHVCLFAAEV
jgi:hypothetical protein